MYAPLRSSLMPTAQLAKTLLAFCLLLALVSAPRAHAQAAPQAAAIAVGGDNLTRLLWNNPGGSIALWRIAADGTVTSSPYGPSPGWATTALAVGGNDQPRIVWNHPADGQMSLWSVDAADNFSQTSYGPYPGWAAQAIAVGGDSRPRLVWDKAEGTLSLWNVGAANSLA